GILPSFALAGATRPTRRHSRRSALASCRARWPTKRPPIPSIRTCGAFPPLFAARPLAPLIAVTPVGRGRLFLRPLRAKAEALQLAQIEFVEIRGRILLGSVVVHVVRKKAGL